MSCTNVCSRNAFHVSLVLILRFANRQRGRIISVTENNETNVETTIYILTFVFQVYLLNDIIVIGPLNLAAILFV